MRIKILIVLCVFNMLAVYSQENILDIYNGDFESGMDYWRFFEIPGGQESNSVISTDAVSGDYAMSLNLATDYGHITDRGLDNWDAKVPISEGVLYTLKAFVKGDTNSTRQLTKVGFTLGFFDAEGSVISSRKRDFPVNDIYAEKSLQFKAPEGAVSCWVAFRLFDATDPCAPLRKMYIDNVRVLRPSGVSVDPNKAVESESIRLSNYPNPLTSQTTISYHLPESSVVSIKVYNILGQDIASLLDHQQQHAGNHQVHWVPGKLKAGIFFYRLEVLSVTDRITVLNRKMILENGHK